MWFMLFLINLIIFNTASSDFFSDRSIVKSANAICAEDGIAANIEFNRFFDGKIYSANYSTNPDCIYHNTNDTPILAIEFVIPLNKCGTRISRNTRNIVDLIENLICVQMEKEIQVSLDRHFLFTCQLAPPPELIQAQNGETSISNKILKYGLSSQEAEPEFKPENNWGNWPINSTSISSTPISASVSSEGKFENWPLELSTTGKTLSVNRLLITTATTSATDVSTKSNENLNTLMKILEKIKFWHNVVSTPLFSNKITSEMNTNISTTTAVDTKVTLSAARENSTSRWRKPLESVRIFATQLPNQKSTTDMAIYLEIQDNDEVPFGNTINRPIQIGENISLVIRGRSRNSKGDTYNLFVHSCYASDKQGLAKIMLIDRFGCAVQPKLTGQMIRMKKAGQTYYYFRFSAFKFPGPDDVYFTCAVDISQNESFPKKCGTTRNETR